MPKGVYDRAASKRKTKWNAAMIDVKKLVNKHSRSIIADCLENLDDYEKTRHRLVELHREMEELKAKL